MQSNEAVYKTISLGVLVFIIATLFAFALRSYPMLGVDSMYHSLTAINHKLGRGLINQISPEVFIVGDPSGTGKSLIFPPLYPLLLSWLMPSGTPMGIHIATFFMYASTILIAAFVFKKIFIPDYRNTSLYQLAVYAFSLFALTAHVIWSPGRPETPMRLFVAAMLLCLVYREKRWLWAFIGFVFGLMATTHPGPILLIAPFVGMFFAFTYPTKKALRLMIFAIILSFTIFFIVTEFFGNGFMETVDGVTQQVSRFNIGGPVTRYLDHNRAFIFLPIDRFIQNSPRTIINGLTYGSAFFGILFSTSLVCLVILYRRFRSGIASPVLFYLSGTTLAASLAIIFFSNQTYLLALSPLWILTIGYTALHISNSRVFKLIALAVLMLGSIYFFYRLALFPYFLTSGTSLEEARQIFVDLPLDPKEKIGVDGTMWVISENYERMYNWGGLDNVLYPTSTIIMREGFNGRTTLPEEVSYCRVKYDFFTHKVPTLFGIPISYSKTLPSYAFAVYDCSPEDET